MPGNVSVLIMRSGNRLCGLPAEQVLETMRPLPTDRVAAAPSFVRGLSVIRGGPTLVLDLARLLGEEESDISRFVLVNMGDKRHGALAVEKVLELRVIQGPQWEALPPLLGQAAAGVFDAIASLDSQLVLLLSAARFVTADAWETWAKPEP